MTDTDRSPGMAPAPAPGPPGRAPYAAPRLMPLGTIAELTRGTTPGGLSDGTFGSDTGNAS